MQTFKQTFAANDTWELYVSGKYFTVLACTNPVAVRFFKGGKLLDLGQIENVPAGLEVTLGEIGDHEFPFDRVQIDVTGPDTVTIGIGNGQARLNISKGQVEVISAKAPQSGAWWQADCQTDDNSRLILPANPARQFLAFQNQGEFSGAGVANTYNIWISLTGGDAVASSACLKLPPGAYWESNGAVSTAAVHAIADSPAGGSTFGHVWAHFLAMEG